MAKSISYQQWKSRLNEPGFTNNDEWWIKKETETVQEKVDELTGETINENVWTGDEKPEIDDVEVPREDSGWDRPSYADYLKKKKAAKKEPKEPKEKPPRKVFNVGDIIILVKKEQKKLPEDAYEFLLTYSKFEVKEVNENGNLYLGFDRNGEHFMFAPNRFELKPLDKPKAAEKDPFDFEDED